MYLTLDSALDRTFVDFRIYREMYILTSDALRACGGGGLGGAALFRLVRGGATGRGGGSFFVLCTISGSGFSCN